MQSAFGIFFNYYGTASCFRDDVVSVFASVVSPEANPFRPFSARVPGVGDAV
jgi:hypothetical protein